MQTNYVAPVAIGESMHDRFMRGVDRVREQQQMNQVLQQQAIKEKAIQEADYSGIYDFKTEGWSQEYKNAFLQLQNHVRGKVQRTEYKDGEFNQALQQLYNQWESIDRLWRDTRESKENFINVLTNKEQFEDDSTMIMDTAEDLNQKIEMSRTWGLIEGTLSPDLDNIEVRGVYQGLEDQGLIGMDIVSQNIANPSFFNYQTAPKAQTTPEDIYRDFQSIVQGLIETGKSKNEVERIVKEKINANASGGKYGRSPQAYFQARYNTDEEVEGMTHNEVFANDTWDLFQTYWPEDTTGSGSGSGDEEAPLTPQDIKLYGPENNATLMQGAKYPLGKEYAVNFASWIGKSENFDIIQSALSEAGLSLDKVDSNFLPQEIRYSDGKFTIVGPMTPNGTTIPGLNMTFDPTVMADQPVIAEIERRYQDIYGVKCTLEEIVTRRCNDLNESVIEEAVDWGGL
jgi:hypothetical protein